MRLVFIVLSGALAVAWIASLAHRASRHPEGRAPFQSLGFLSSMLLAWISLGGFGLVLPAIARLILGSVVLFLAVSLLGPGPRSAGLRAPLAHGDAARLRRRRALTFAATAGALLGGTFLLLADPLPRASRAVLAAGAGLREIAAPLVDAVTRLFHEREPDEGGGGAMTSSGAERNFGETRSLPLRADIQQGDELELFLRIPDPDDFARAVAGSPYVRSTVMNHFTGDGWQLAEGEEHFVSDADDGKSDGMINLRPRVTAGIRHDVYVKDSAASALPALQGLVSVGFDNLLVRADGWYVAGVQGDVHYSAVSAPINLESIPADAVSQGGRAPEAYLEVPADLRPRLREILLATAPRDRNLRARLDALSAYCADHFAYSLKVANPDGLPPIENFLFHEKRGYCDLFATSGVLLCREMGIPARIAFGHAGGDSFPSEGVLSFSSRHGHSWTEIYLEDYGWVIYDLTPKSAGRAAARRGESSRLPTGEAFADARVSDELEESITPSMSWLERIPARAVYAVLGLLLLAWLLAGVLGRVFGKEDKDERRRRRSRRDRDSRYQGSGFAYPDYFLDFRKLCRALGIRDDEGHTLRDLLRTLRGNGLDAARFEEMSTYHYATRYEEAERDTHREKQFRREIRQFWKESAPS